MGAAIWDTIREATRMSHSRLDVALAKLDLAIPLYYEGFLRSQAEALFPIEAALEANGIESLIPDWAQRIRTPALERDLATLNITCHPLPLPAFGSAAEMLGAVYVLEASRMGARVMLARLAEHPDSDAMNATAYLRHGFGKRFWPSFLTLLETHPAAQSDTAGVVHGAEIAFAMFESALKPMENVVVDFTRADKGSGYAPTPG
ncbi:biliverdin-producing heme oxygenase [Afipia massiliensis]|uniref:Biliverdin-producing heme oxygenase n=1 Tax=Afipia massiliensis TaxID=211460 RepID=A0A4U6BNI9_9BRAD|nr:biliverdin-producing heme oxygenase [Afipia massiliensis]TKT71015.1 biliverdin-producing heme oxygenase [Afipia massiliensis]